MNTPVSQATSSFEFNPTRTVLLETFALDAAIVRGTGYRLFDAEGREYLDFLSQYGALPFGHNPPELWEALAGARAEEVPSMIQPLRPVEAERLAKRLAALTPGDLEICTFANSGAETVEAAIKLARARTGRDLILSTTNGFHGKTLGALSATGKPLYQLDFAAPAPGFDYVPFGDIDALAARVRADGDQIAAFMLEPIQGEGGVVCPPDGYLDAAIELCRRHGVLSIVDEIQTGLGRTGELFVSAGAAEAPDMLLLAKALGGGMMPIGACIVRPEAWDDRFGLLHSSTFANNNLACRVANATLDLLERDDGRIVREVAANGAYLRRRLEALREAYPDAIRDVRGRGYMVGLEFARFDRRDDSATMAFCSLNRGVTPLFSSYLFNVHGVLTAPLFNESHVLRLQPPLVAGPAQIDQAVDALGGLCDAISRRDYHKIVRHLVADERGKEASPAWAAPQTGATARRTDNPRPNTFGFLIHYTEEADITRSDPSLAQFSPEELSDWRSWVKRLGPGFVRRVPAVRSRSGASADGWILSIPMLPEDMRGRSRGAATAMIEGAIDLAAERGLSRFGLGAFTSIVTKGGETVTGRGVPVTSGNTLTTVTAVVGLERVLQRVGVDLGRSRVAVVGATGAIGRLAALMLARRAGEMILVGNPGNPYATKLLRRVSDEVYATLLAPRSPFSGEMSYRVQAAARRLGISHVDAEDICAGGRDAPLTACFDLAFDSRGESLPLTCTTDTDAALRSADVVLVATSSDIALVDPRRLTPGTIVCDVSRPPNVARADLSGTGVLVYDGGLVQPPFPLDLGPFQTLPANLCWGCLGETMLLALEGDIEDYSIGGKLSLRQADYIAALARKHGFEPAAPQWYGEVLEDEDFDRVAAQVSVAAPKHRGMRPAGVIHAAE
jgi:acetylornithine/succinyldiaminopimelate/putrescine aminotransferase/predicted amino acid dehydrogenase